MTPDEFTSSEQFVEVGDGHSLYVYDWGNRQAQTPIIFLHGGPGGRSQDKYKAAFDPKRQRVIFFDQRGCGKSTPYGSLEHNTTQDLVEDIEKIAQHFNLKKCIVNGSSWGSALALCFAIAHPERVKALVIGGVWTCTASENDWLDKGGMRVFYPESWERYAASAPVDYQDSPSAYHFPRILGDNEAEAHSSAYAYSTLEGSVMSLDDRFTPENIDDFDPNPISTEVHYLVNRCFIPDQYILNSISKLTMPIYMVQGRYDMVCPPITAYTLHQKLPNSELIWTIGNHKAEHESWNVMRNILLQLTQVA